jgi:hypothetical protein
VSRRVLAIGAGVLAGSLFVAVPAGAKPSPVRGGSTTPTTAACKGTNLKATAHNDAVRREGTLADLVAKLQARTNPFSMNGPQISTLQSASSGISALDNTIQTTCYPSIAALRTDWRKMFDDYRVYWLRVPQSHGIEAADHLAEAQSKLAGVASKLAGYVGSNAQAQADLAAMNQQLQTAGAKLGTPPTPGPSIAALAGLAPATDMTANTAALQAAHNDLVAARAALAQARADGQKVIADLKS